MASEGGKPRTRFAGFRPTTHGSAIALDEAVPAGVGFPRAPEVDDQLLGLVEVLHRDMFGL
jgi:hypothetical protein